MADLLTTGLIAAAIAAGGTAAGGSANGGSANEAETAPVHLVTEKLADGVRIRVVGRSASAFDASYALEVSSDVAGGRNRSTQRGSVRLKPGVLVEMTTVTLGNVANGGWTARLTVEPAGAAAYEEVRSSSAS